jgi:hypothetical protein
MNELFRGLGRLALGCCILWLALPVWAAHSGDVVTVTDDCEYSLGVYPESAWSAGATNFALASALRDQLGSPVYLCQGWERSNGTAAGATVRAYVAKDGQVWLADGLQLSDGRVMVNGEILDRARPL